MKVQKRVLVAGMAAASLMLVTACSSTDSTDSTDAGTTAESTAESADAGAMVEAAMATSAADFGGLEGLVTACQAEGKLNVIALPPDWANYGAIIAGFADKYGVEVDSQQPDANSQDEINAATQNAGTDRAPDVFDVGQAVALANTAMYAPYQVERFADIPAAFKDANGLWVNDYGGFMAVGYDANKVPEITSLDDLLGPDFKGAVALNGDPTQASAGWNGVMMASIANGGSVDDIAPGVEYFKVMNEAGNFLPVDPTPATIESGQTPVVFDWDYLQAGQVAGLAEKGIDWRIFVPETAVIGGYYYQAINADAPNPACARLWQEYLYSPDGQNGWLAGGARPVLADVYAAEGTLDAEAFAKLPPVSGDPVVPNDKQVITGNEYLIANWSAAVGG
jgi:putative spermidine/putrescine transport system substrate-binding protein